MSSETERPKLDLTVRDRLIAIVGPTAVGKTDLAMRLAQRMPIEIIGADSRQVYRHMDIGTAKPCLEERAAVPHHIVDIIDPDDEFSLGEYLVRLNNAIKTAKSNRNTPVLVGGTGQYVMALLEGWIVPPVPPNAALRQRLEAELAANGLGPVVDELRTLDPAALDSVDLKNPRRVIRAIERAVAGYPRGAQTERAKPSFESVVIGLGADRAELHSRADRRFDLMMANGFLEEVRELLDAGYAPELPAMSGIGYSELADHLLNCTDLQESLQRAKYRTHRYIRQQSNWFRASDPRIKWFGPGEVDRAVEYGQSRIESPPKLA